MISSRLRAGPCNCMTASTSWVPFCGCPFKKSHSIQGLCLGPWFLETPIAAGEAEQRGMLPTVWSTVEGGMTVEALRPKESKPYARRYRKLSWVMDAIAFSEHPRETNKAMTVSGPHVLHDLLLSYFWNPCYKK